MKIPGNRFIKNKMKSLDRTFFAQLPTPVEALPRLSYALGGPQIFVKRDDQTGLAFGGNKTRKLEFLIAEAKSLHSKCLITTGAIQSNHCRQTAAAAARFGFECILILTGKQQDRFSANLLLDHLFGAHIIIAATSEDCDRILKETFDNAERAGKRPYFVPYGGSSPTGVVGYVFAMQELMENKSNPDYIILASSSGGTQAGLILGKHLFGFSGRVLGVSIDESSAQLSKRISSLASDASVKISERKDFSPEEVMVTDEYCKAGYGVLTELEREALKIFAEQEGLLLDPVYTGRAAAGMIDLIRKGFFAKNETILFWHTGGTPALFADKYSDSLI